MPEKVVIAHIRFNATVVRLKVRALIDQLIHYPSFNATVVRLKGGEERRSTHMTLLFQCHSGSIKSISQFPSLYAVR